MCQHTLQSSPARDGHGSSGMCCGCSVELMLAVQVLRSLRQPASQETVALSPLSRHGVALEWCLKHQMWGGMVGQPVRLSLT